MEHSGREFESGPKHFSVLPWVDGNDATSQEPCRVFSIPLDTKCIIPDTVNKNGKNTDRNFNSFSVRVFNDISVTQITQHQW